MGRLRRAWHRLRDVMLVDADVFFERLDRRRRARFRRHPVAMHVIYIGGNGGMLVVAGLLIGWRFVAELMIAMALLYVVLVSSLVIRARRHGS